jgi:uncharacterized protein YgbK (DUF1537 family)
VIYLLIYTLRVLLLVPPCSPYSGLAKRKEIGFFWHEINLVITKSGNFGDAHTPLDEKKPPAFS